MGEECKNRRKWEEDIYWSHFQVVQFFKVLSGRFDHQLAIPRKFAINLREKLAGSVSLRGPSGATWTVRLIADGDALFLKHGWKEFVDAHILKEDDLLIFKYNGGSQFDVLMFDRQSFCEKEASYFVKKCAHSDAASGGKTKRSIPESCDTANDSSHEVFEGTARKKPRKNTDTASESSHEVFEGTVRKKPRKIGAFTSTGTRPNGKLRTREMKGTSGKSMGGYDLQLISNRRAVNEEEKKKAFDMATAAVTENSFRVVMRPSHVYKRFYMSIPSEWARIHLPCRSLDVMLRVKENTWKARFYPKGNSGGYSGGLTCGWKNFVLENFLEEFDVCVFSLTSSEDGDPILDVSIFRVVEEVIPPSHITPASSKQGRKPNKFMRKTKLLELSL